MNFNKLSYDELIDFIVTTYVDDDMLLRNITRQFSKVNGLINLACFYCEYIAYECELYDYYPINGRKFSTGESEEIVCGIDDCTDYYRCIIDYLKFNNEVKKQLKLIELRKSGIPNDVIDNVIVNFM